MKQFLMEASAADRLILVEPVKRVTKEAIQEEEWGPQPRQQMVLRAEASYIELFKELGLEILCQQEFGTAMKAPQK